MKGKIHKILVFSKCTIESFPLWFRILTISIITFLTYTSIIFTVNVLDGLLADYRVNLFCVFVIIANLSFSSHVRKIQRNIKNLLDRIVSEDGVPPISHSQEEKEPTHRDKTAKSETPASHAKALIEISEELGDAFSETDGEILVE